MHEQKVARMYLREFFGALAIYSVMVVLTIMYGRGMPEGFVRTLVLASPMIGFLLMTWAAARQIKRVDEYIRQFVLENLSIAAAITAGVTFTYGFLETAGYPQLSMFYVLMVMAAAWALTSFVRAWLNR
jgi:hypothetical protein